MQTNTNATVYRRSRLLDIKREKQATYDKYYVSLTVLAGCFIFLVIQSITMYPINDVKMRVAGY